MHPLEPFFVIQASTFLNSLLLFILLGPSRASPTPPLTHVPIYIPRPFPTSPPPFPPSTPIPAPLVFLGVSWFDSRICKTVGKCRKQRKQLYISVAPNSRRSSGNASGTTVHICCFVQQKLKFPDTGKNVCRLNAAYIVMSRHADAKWVDARTVEGIC